MPTARTGKMCVPVAPNTNEDMTTMTAGLSVYNNTAPKTKKKKPITIPQTFPKATPISKPNKTRKGK